MNCPSCGNKPVITNHQSVDLEPPKNIDNVQEPVLTNELKNYPLASYVPGYYGIPGFPYTGTLARIDDYIS